MFLAAGHFFAFFSRGPPGELRRGPELPSISAMTANYPGPIRCGRPRLRACGAPIRRRLPGGPLARRCNKRCQMTRTALAKPGCRTVNASLTTAGPRSCLSGRGGRSAELSQRAFARLLQGAAFCITGSKERNTFHFVRLRVKGRDPSPGRHLHAHIYRATSPCVARETWSNQARRHGVHILFAQPIEVQI